MTIIKYTPYYEKIVAVYNGSLIASFDYQFSLSDIIYQLTKLNYISTGEDFKVTSEALLFAEESNLFFNPIKDNKC